MIWFVHNYVAANIFLQYALKLQTFAFVAAMVFSCKCRCLITWGFLFVLCFPFYFKGHRFSFSNMIFPKISSICYSLICCLLFIIVGYVLIKIFSFLPGLRQIIRLFVFIEQHQTYHRISDGQSNTRLGFNPISMYKWLMHLEWHHLLQVGTNHRNADKNGISYPLPPMPPSKFEPCSHSVQRNLNNLKSWCFWQVNVHDKIKLHDHEIQDRLYSGQVLRNQDSSQKTLHLNLIQ